MMSENSVITRFINDIDKDGTIGVEFIIRGAKTRIVVFINSGSPKNSYWIIASKDLNILEHGSFPEEFIKYIYELEEYKWMYLDNSG